jgi:hypothetical protein
MECESFSPFWMIIQENLDIARGYFVVETVSSLTTDPNPRSKPADCTKHRAWLRPAEWERWWTEMINARSMNDKKAINVNRRIRNLGYLLWEDLLKTWKLFNEVESRDSLSNFYNRFVAEDKILLNSLPVHISQSFMKVPSFCCREHQDLSLATCINRIMKKLNRANCPIRLTVKLSSYLHSHEHHEETPPYPYSTGRDIENDVGSSIPEQWSKIRWTLLIPHEQASLEKRTLRCKIQWKRAEEGAETTVMKAEESAGQQTQPFEFNIWTARRNWR